MEVGTAGRPSFDSRNSPWSFITLAFEPITARTAVAPMQIRTSGSTTSISASSHGAHAWISSAFGVWWIRRFPSAST